MESCCEREYSLALALHTAGETGPNALNDRAAIEAPLLERRFDKFRPQLA